MSSKDEAITVEELIAYLQGYLKDFQYGNTQKISYRESHSKRLENGRAVFNITGIQYDKYGRVWLV